MQTLSTPLQVEERTLFKRVDMNFAFVIFALNVIGLINLYSATHGVHVDDNSRLFWQQLVWLAGGWIIYFGVTLVDYQFFLRGAFSIHLFLHPLLWVWLLYAGPDAPIHGLVGTCQSG